MEETARGPELLYETRHHASRPCASSYPPQQASHSSSGSFLSLISVKGVSQFREKWSQYKQPRKLRKMISLFVSSTGERVAVAAGNQITVLQRKDDYMEPCGTFTNRSFCTFTAGAWSESHDVLGVVDDSGTLYFIKANGEEISRITRSSLKVPLPIVGLIAPDTSASQRFPLSGFTVATSDGSLQHVEIGDVSVSISSACTSTIKKHFQSIVCLDYHPKLSLVAAVGCPTRGKGCYCLALWHKKHNADQDDIFDVQFDSLYSKPESYQGQMSYPKVSISPGGTFVATLEINGDVYVFRSEYESSSLSRASFGGKLEPEDLLRDIVDFTWWSDQILTLAKRNGDLIMVDIIKGLKVKDKDHSFYLPVLERFTGLEGWIFLVDATYKKGPYSSTSAGKEDLPVIAQNTEYSFDHFDVSRLHWSLMTYSERSVHEMYNVLISTKKYEAALEFADVHGLDRDEVLKSRWLNSDQGSNEVRSTLSIIKDRAFILSECIEKVGSTEEAAKALIEYGLLLTSQYVFSESDDETDVIWDFRISRLKLLQYKDRLETYIGINMGRFSVQEFRKFRNMPMDEVATGLAESGKIGALNLLFKRHPYSLAPSMLEVLAAIPETVPAQTYGQLLPGSVPPSSIAVRGEDWVESKKMVDFLNRIPRDNQIPLKLRTEPIVKRSFGYYWPSTDELSKWYKKRALDIDSFTGQLDNCLCLVEIGLHKGITELQKFHEDVTYLNRLIYEDDSDEHSKDSMSLTAWEQLNDYEKFRMMLKGVDERTAVQSLYDKALPFMQKRQFGTTSYSEDNRGHSFLLRWLKEIALENKLEICLMVFEEGCKDFEVNNFFQDEAEVVDCALQCVYLCTSTDKWSSMANILSKLPQDTESGSSGLEKRRKVAEGHIEAGRILAFYQVPKPINFLVEAHSDEKGVKQIFRLILSKFIRRQHGQSDNDWTSMWRDMQSLREKAFAFLDPEYMLVEFCRGLLKAGKFSLARNYLKGTGSVALAPEKAENLVILAAREYFFSASSLASSEIWKAKECLNLFPGSSSIKEEADIMDALTVKLPRLGVTILPVQFKQIKNPMEIIKMAITSQPGAYLHVDELVEVSRLLGLNSQEDISAVEEAIAREAAVAGDLQLAFDLCLVLVKKGHGLIWDLCAAIARGPAIDNMDVSSRKLLIGFALSHCDEESIAELLHAWKDLDMHGQCETMAVLTGTSPPNTLSHEVVNFSEDDGSKVHLDTAKNTLSLVARKLPSDDWESLLRDNEKITSFAAWKLPWLLELSQAPEYGKNPYSGYIAGGAYISAKVQSMLAILYWLVKNGFSPKDDLVASLAKSVLESPATEEEDIMGCSFLLNLVDAFSGVEVIEEELRMRKDYQEISSIMNVGMKYGLLHNLGVECKDSTHRRELLLKLFKEKHMPVNSDAMEQFGKVQSTFWREWKIKLEGQKRVTDHTRVLEQIIPGVEAARFLSGDVNYIHDAVFSLIETLKREKKRILKDLLEVANTYGLDRTEVLLSFLCSVLVSEVWTNDEIAAEIADVKGEIVGFGQETIKIISLTVYPEIDGCNKQRLAYLFGLLADCYLCQEEKDAALCESDRAFSSFGRAYYYKHIERQCLEISFVENLDFKNIAGLDGLNVDGFSAEVFRNLEQYCLEALARMVDELVSIYTRIDPLPNGIISGQTVYKQYILGLLSSVETNAGAIFDTGRPETFQGLISLLEDIYDRCKSYITQLAPSDSDELMKKFFTVSFSSSGSRKGVPDNSAWQDCIILLMNFFLRLAEEMQEISSSEDSEEMFAFNPQCQTSFFKSLTRLVMEDSVSPNQAWGTIVDYVNAGFVGDFAAELPILCRAMIFSGCGFGVISEVFSEAVSQSSHIMADQEIQDLWSLYLDILESILQGLCNQLDGQENLCQLLSSLSRMEGDLENLKKVRQAVWDRMADFSSGSKLPGQCRVYVLELMQLVTGSHVTSSSPKHQAKALQWEGWDESNYMGGRSRSATGHGSSDYPDSSNNRFTSTLVALRTTHIAGPISPGLEVTPEDLADIPTAVSCFTKLCEEANTESHLDALVAVLGEWEGLFVSNRDKEPSSIEASAEGGDGWGEDDWNDEGWESFQELEPVDDKEKKGNSLSLHPLHQCWTELLRKYISLSNFGAVIRLLDRSLAKTSGTLVDEDGARSLSGAVMEKDCFTGLKMVLLLPYVELQKHCLEEVEEKLKQEGITERLSNDLEFLVIASSSGISSMIISEPSFDATFSYLCYLIGHFARQSQQNQLSTPHDDAVFLLFGRVLLPAFICELVKADQHVLAGIIVTKYMHTNPTLSVINIAEASLRRFLEGQLHVLESNEELVLEKISSSHVLKSVVSSLQGKLGDMIREALPLLPSKPR